MTRLSLGKCKNITVLDKTEKKVECLEENRD